MRIGCSFSYLLLFKSVSTYFLYDERWQQAKSPIDAKICRHNFIREHCGHQYNEESERLIHNILIVSL